MNIEIRGLEELYRKLGKAAATETLVPPMHKAVLQVQRDMAKYPPQARNTTYRRTGTLGRRWTTRVDRVGGGVRGKVGNNTEYGPWVQSNEFQARVHQGRWQTDEQVKRANKGKIERMFQDAVDKALED